MFAARFRVHLMDEAPRIGSGLRIVNVMIGRKVAHVYDDYGHRKKFPLKVWQEIARSAIPMPPRKKFRKRKSPAPE